MKNRYLADAEEVVITSFVWAEILNGVAETVWATIRGRRVGYVPSGCSGVANLTLRRRQIDETIQLVTNKSLFTYSEWPLLNKILPFSGRRLLNFRDSFSQLKLHKLFYYSNNRLIVITLSQNKNDKIRRLKALTGYFCVTIFNKYGVWNVIKLCNW